MDGSTRRRRRFEDHPPRSPPQGGTQFRGLDREIEKTRKTTWQQRRDERDRIPTPRDLWTFSPPPPQRLADRLEVGGDERRKKERRQKRKEERRAERQAKHAQISRQDPSLNTTGKNTPLSAPNSNPNDNDAAAHEDGTSAVASAVKSREAGDGEEDDEDEVLGPAVPPGMARESSVHYGKAMRPGEGEKIAAFVQEGVRIPRRGEIGLSSNEIESYETQGYVMSGSRNRRMEAVRIRKENQVYTVEELAALRDFSREERQLREDKVLNQFRQLVDSKLGDNSAPKPDQDGQQDSK